MVLVKGLCPEFRFWQLVLASIEPEFRPSLGSATGLGR
jgi:hypothetical protein